MAGTKLSFHFEQAVSEEEIGTRAPFLARDGWRPITELRRVEVKSAKGGQNHLFSQVYSRPSLFPICKRIGEKLPSRFKVLTGEAKRCEHMVHFYDDQNLFLDSLEAFVLEGLMAGEAVVVIAKSERLSFLLGRLRGHGLDIDTLENDMQFAALDAELALSTFLVNGLPNQMLFEHVLGGLLAGIRQQHQKVRAFGEMVGILWSDGNRTATYRLEEMWHQYCAREGLMLYCAYPWEAFEGEEDAMKRICATHSQLIAR